MTILEAVVYGVVQGVTEWLPVSSTAHLRIVPTLFGWQDPGASFTAVIQLGTILAVLIYFRHDLGRALGAWFRSLGQHPGGYSADARMGWAVFWGSLPIVGFGYAFREQIRGNEIRSLWIVSVALVVMGVVMLLSEVLSRRDREIGSVTVRDGVLVGLFQALALIPGMSRSGSTITGALFCGFERSAAARFSFLLSVPSITAAGLFELHEAREAILGRELVPAAVATAVSFVVGYASIAFLMKYLQKRGLGIFVYYRVALGLILLVLLSTGQLDPAAGLPQKPIETATAQP